MAPMSSSRIFVRNLPPTLTDEDFKSYFSQKHQVTDVKYLAHRRIGYVGYKTPEDAAHAVKYFNKSFIRMSKIGVELARPIADGPLPIHRARVPWNAAVEDVITGTKIGEPGGEGTTTQNSLKRKREGSQEKTEDPKLKEFLGVMQRPSKSKSWLNEATDGAEEVPIVSEGVEHSGEDKPESNGEYQTISKKSKIRTVVNKEERPSRLETTYPPELILPNSLAGVEQEETLNGPLEGQSDADWLRSKISRLLGLVDEDEDIHQPIQQPVEEDDDAISEASEKVEKQRKPKQSAGLAGFDNVDEDEPVASADEEAIRASRRLFLRNLPYTITEDDINEHFASIGGLEEVHVPMDSKSGTAKGFAYIQYKDADNAIDAFRTMDSSIFQGRLLHILPAAPKRENKLDEFALSKLPLKQQRQIKRKTEASSSSFNWNALYMNTDAVMSSISARLGVDKSTLLDPTSSDAAVKQAFAETHIIQETRSYFASNGVDLEAFKNKKRGDTAILVKNFPFGTNPDELRGVFEEHGNITRFLMPPNGTIAIVEFAVAPEARAAFKSLAYRKMKDTILFLEPAPKDIFSGAPKPVSVLSTESHAVAPRLSTADFLRNEAETEAVDTSTLFVRNLNFTTTSQRMTDVFSPLDGFISARVKTKTDPKKPGQVLSMGFGFLEFRTKEQAQAALKAMNGYNLEGHKLDIRASQKALDAAEERRKEDKAKASADRGTKIIIKNLPFEASKKEVRSLFGAYGQLRSVRLPKKYDSSTRGFAFAEFSTSREAANAMDALRNTHLLGRRLVLEFAAAEAEDAEEELERMQQKVGSQAHKIAIQKLTGTGRKKFNVSGDDPE